MTDLLHNTSVLVLNRNWQAINTISPAEAFCQMVTDTATALDIRTEDHMTPMQWEEWINLPIRNNDQAVHTSSLTIRVPTVIVLSRYAQVPLTRPKFSARALRERDNHQCQYSGKILKTGEGNIDHVIPRSRGGQTNWTNCVWACRIINTKKGDRTPAEAGLRLLRKPFIPRQVPVTALLRNTLKIPDWNPFLIQKSA